MATVTVTKNSKEEVTAADLRVEQHHMFQLWLTGLQVANLHRQLQRRDVVCGHEPLGDAAAPVLHTESRDRRAAVGSRDPGDVCRAFSRHGDGRAIGRLRHW